MAGDPSPTVRMETVLEARGPAAAIVLSDDAKKPETKARRLAAVLDVLR